MQDYSDYFDKIHSQELMPQIFSLFFQQSRVLTCFLYTKWSEVGKQAINEKCLKILKLRGSIELFFPKGRLIACHDICFVCSVKQSKDYFVYNFYLWDKKKYELNTVLKCFDVYGSLDFNDTGSDSDRKWQGSVWCETVARYRQCIDMEMARNLRNL